MARTKICPECYGVMLEQKRDITQMQGDLKCRDCGFIESGY